VIASNHMASDDNDVPSCRAHPDGVADGCFACHILSKDILSCPDHPTAADDCAACDAITAVWADWAMDCSEKAERDGGAQLAWHGSSKHDTLLS
jgi:hypothetical protein